LGLVSLLVIALSLPFGSRNAAADAVIDDYQSSANFAPPNGQFETNAFPGPTAITEAKTPAAFFGSSRTVTIGHFTGDSANDEVRVKISGGLLSYMSSIGGDADLTLEYTSAGEDLSGFAGIELSLLSFDWANSTDLPITVDLNGTADLTKTLTSAGSFVVDFPFADFTGVVNLASITSLTISFDAQKAHDFDIGPILAFDAPVPEPWSVMVWSVVGLVGLVLLRRRLK
jgi:hypothetical protein